MHGQKFPLFAVAFLSVRNFTKVHYDDVVSVRIYVCPFGHRNFWTTEVTAMKFIVYNRHHRMFFLHFSLRNCSYDAWIICSKSANRFTRRPRRLRLGNDLSEENLHNTSVSCGSALLDRLSLFFPRYCGNWLWSIKTSAHIVPTRLVHLATRFAFVWSVMQRKFGLSWNFLLTISPSKPGKSSREDK